MNIEQAKAIPLSDILKRLGHEPAREHGRQTWYLSPLRNEKRPSFHVHLERNVWYDHGDGRGGNALDFAIFYLEAQGRRGDVSDALAFLQDLMGKSYVPMPRKEPGKAKCEKVLEIVSLKTVQHPALIQYLKARGLDVDIARLYLKQASVRNRETDKRFFSLAFSNEDGGYELRTPYFKGAVSPKAISFMRGSVVKPDGIHVFEGWADFLSVLTRDKKSRLAFDAIILNSVSMLDPAFAYLKGYGYEKLFTWMDNDVAGDRATMRLAEFARTEEGLTHYPMNQIYSGHKDVNAWHKKNLNL